MHLNGSIGRGSTGVDLNAIPVSAIERIEVLRDGAAAQYGSDAIAGVINIVLKGGESRPTLTSKFGLSTGSVRRQPLHAERPDLRGGRRHRLLGRRAVRRRRLVGHRGRQGQRDRRGRVPPSQPHEPRVVRSARPDRRRATPATTPSPQPNHRWGDPDTRDVMTFVNASVPLNAPQTRFLYALRRLQPARGEQRRASTAARSTSRNWPQIYPLGFLPVIEPTVVDVSGTAGVRGVVRTGGPTTRAASTATTASTSRSATR